MSSLLNKVKDKLHIGKDKDDVGSTTYNSGKEELGSKSGGVGHQTAGQTVGGGHQSAGQTVGGGHTSTASAAHGTGVSATPAGQSNASAQQSSTSAGAATGGARVAGTQQGVSSGAHHGGSTSAVSETVTIHERDPNWHKARELTHAAEQQSKVSAAKAYEAEAFLVGAQESHDKAQLAVNKHAELVAQAEAEKRNIGAADYVHREYDHAKKEAEDREKHHIEINKNLDKTRDLVAAKEKELGAVAPGAAAKQKELDNLSNKLGSLQSAKKDLENKHDAHATKLAELESQKGKYVSELERLEGQVASLNKRADDLEAQARAARNEAQTAANRLKELKSHQSSIARDADAASRGLQAVEKDLEGYRQRELELNKRLTAGQADAKRAADAAAAKEAELQLAKQQFEAERQKGLPVEQDIERYRKVVQEKEREYIEAQESSKAAKAAYEKFLAESNAAKKEADALIAEKETKLATYNDRKQEATVASSRAAEMWADAKKFGNTGDVNALQRLAEAEKNLGEVAPTVNAPLVAPQVAPKQPTTEGPKIHRTENAKENNEDTSKETIKTKY